MQEINPTPEWKTSASLVCNVLPHCVRWLQQNNHTMYCSETNVLLYYYTTILLTTTTTSI